MPAAATPTKAARKMVEERILRKIGDRKYGRKEKRGSRWKRMTGYNLRGQTSVVALVSDERKKEIANRRLLG